MKEKTTVIIKCDRYYIILSKTYTDTLLFNVTCTHTLITEVQNFTQITVVHQYDMYHVLIVFCFLLNFHMSVSK